MGVESNGLPTQSQVFMMLKIPFIISVLERIG